MSTNSPPPQGQRGSRWREYAGGVLSVVALAIALRSCAQSDEALRLSRADFIAKRTLVIMGAVTVDTITFYVSPVAGLKAAFVLGDTIIAPAEGVDTVQPVPGVYIPITPNLHRSSIRHFYTGMHLRPVQEAMLLQKVQATFPHRGSSKEQIVYPPDFSLSVAPLVNGLLGYLTVMEFRHPFYAPISQHGLTLPVMLEMSYLAEGSLNSTISVYEVAFDFKFDPVVPGPESFFVANTRALTFYRTVPSREIGQVVMDSIWNRSLQSINHQIIPIHRENLRHLADELRNAIWMLKQPETSSVGSGLQVPVRQVPVDVWTRMSQRRWHQGLKTAESHVKYAYEIILQYNHQLAAIDSIRKHGSNPHRLRMFLDTLASARIAAIGQSALSLYRLSREFELNIPDALYQSALGRNNAEFRLTRGTQTVVVRGEALEDCRTMIVQAVWPVIPETETVECTWAPVSSIPRSSQ